MKIQKGSIIEVKGESARESNYIGTIVLIYRANDAAAGSKNPNDYVLEVKNNKTGEIKNVSGPRVLKAIR